MVTVADRAGPPGHPPVVLRRVADRGGGAPGLRAGAARTVIPRLIVLAVLLPRCSRGDMIVRGSGAVVLGWVAGFHGRSSVDAPARGYIGIVYGGRAGRRPPHRGRRWGDGVDHRGRRGGGDHLRDRQEAGPPAGQWDRARHPDDAARDAAPVLPGRRRGLRGRRGVVRHGPGAGGGHGRPTGRDLAGRGPGPAPIGRMAGPLPGDGGPAWPPPGRRLGGRRPGGRSQVPVRLDEDLLGVLALAGPVRPVLHRGRGGVGDRPRVPRRARPPERAAHRRPGGAGRGAGGAGRGPARLPPAPDRGPDGRAPTGRAQHP